MLPKMMRDYSLKDGSYLRKYGAQQKGVVFPEIDFAVEVQLSLKLFLTTLKWSKNECLPQVVCIYEVHCIEFKISFLSTQCVSNLVSNAGVGITIILENFR